MPSWRVLDWSGFITWALFGTLMDGFVLLHGTLPPLSTTNSHQDFVCVFYTRSSLYNHKVTSLEGEVNPSKKQGLRLTSKCTESGWCGHNPAVPAEDPSQREGPLGIDLRSSFRRGQTSSAICPISHTSGRDVEGSRAQSPLLLILLVCTFAWLSQLYLFVWISWNDLMALKVLTLCPHRISQCFKLHFLHKWLGCDSQCISGLQCVVSKLSMLYCEGHDIKVCHFKPLPIAVFFTLCCRVFLALPAQWGFCPSPPKSSVFILLYNLNWIFLLNSF